MASGGISGTAVAVAAVGGLLVYAGIVDAPLIDAVREVAGGRTPTGRPQQRTEVRWSDAGAAIGDAAAEAADQLGGTGRLTDHRRSAIVAAARRYLGRPYRWGATGPDAFDCSGLVYRALNDAGVTHRRLTSLGYRTWSRARDIPRSQASAGDLVCYSGHIGIAVSNSRMIHAPRLGKPVQETNIYNGQGGPVFRRVSG